MTPEFLTNAQIVTPDGVVQGSLSMSDGTIVAIAPMSSEANAIDLDGGWLLPGFIDTQVNGGGGVLFNDAPTVDTIRAIGEAHAPLGTTAFLPTLISDDLEVIDLAMRAVEDAIAAKVPGVVGIHIEGPFINVARKGIHDPAKFRRLDGAAIRLLTGLKTGRTLVTIAPELCTAQDVRALTAGGAVVAAGHTDATYAVMRAALDAGVTGFTHLYNAMSPLTHRAPGVVGAALDDPTSYCGIIVDGQHVDPVALRIALRAKSVDRFMLVSDAMPTVGSPTKSFRLGERMIEVRNGVCVGPDGTLAGSDLDMGAAVANAVAMLGVSILDASIMAAAAPAAFMGLAGRGRLEVGAHADMVWMDRHLRVRGVWIGGRRVPAPLARTVPTPELV
jgi:N-acetylglucosamine-6-phosphate deacetylase